MDKIGTIVASTAAAAVAAETTATNVKGLSPILGPKNPCKKRIKTFNRLQ